MLYFVGFRRDSDAYWNAVRIWGHPDHLHDRATWTVMGDIPGHATVIIGPHAFIRPRKWRTAHAMA
jgi:hypothetical protein